MTAREFKMPWGKYKGETLEEIYVEDVGYLEWLHDEIENAPDWPVPRTPEKMLIKCKISQCFKEMRNVRICK